MIYTNITQLIGNTPLLEISKEVTWLKHIRLYAKLECFNPFWSLKDRAAYAMFEEKKDEIKQQWKTFVEASSWNTGKALWILSSINKIPFKTVSNRIKIDNLRLAMQFSWSEVEELPGVSDCPDLNDPNSYATFADNLAKNNPEKYHYVDQYFNEKNWQAHYQTGQEILEDLWTVDFLFSMLGTTWSSVWIWKALKGKNPDTKVYWVVAQSWEYIPWSRNSNELWEVWFYSPEFYKEILNETTLWAINWTKSLVQNSWILAGLTAWGTYNAAIKKLKQLDPSLDHDKEYIAVFVVCDRIDPYLNFIKDYSPDLFSQFSTIKKRVSTTVLEDEDSLFLSSEMLKENQDDYFIVDIRGNYSYSLWHIDNSINIVDELFASIIEEGKVFPLNKKIVIACRIWENSPKYVQFLRNQWHLAFSLDWGIRDWKKKGFSLVK